MTKDEIINEIRRSLPLPVQQRIGQKQTRAFVRMVLDSFFDIIVETTAAGEEVKLREFAKFTPRYYGPHKVYTGLTGQYVEARAHMRIIMKPSDRWRETISEGVDTWTNTAMKKDKTKERKRPAKKGSARSAGRK